MAVFLYFYSMEKVLITGGTGLVGKRLSSLLQSKGYEVRIVSRSENPKSPYKSFTWNVKQQSIDEKAFEDLDYIIHLAGAGIADRKWSQQRKQEIIDSRVQSTNLLYHTVEKLQTPLKGFISASAIGIYGSITSERIFEETDASGDDFLGKVCQLWEESAFQFKNKNIRTVVLRIGIVLSKSGGALEKMKTPIITPLGNGKQYMPWIHIDDLCEMYVQAIENESYQGIYNAVAPEHNSNTSFSKILAKSFKKPFLPIGVPGFLLKIIFGEIAALLLQGSRISSEKIKQRGFKFQFPHLKGALNNLM